MSAVSRGNTKEVRSAKLLEHEGWVVGSRRHIPGPGDLLAVCLHGVWPLLVEVKATQTPWVHFRPPAREEMVRFARQNGLKPMLAWWAPGAKRHELIGEEDWPR